MSVIVVLEQRGGKLIRISHETLAAGIEIGKATGLPVEAVLLGHSLSSLAAEASGYGASKIITLDHPLLADYTAEGYTLALEQLIRERQPEFVLFPHTYQVRDYAPKLSARFRTSLVSDVVGIKGEGSAITFIRQLFGGKLNADMAGGQKPVFASIQASVFRAAESSGAGTQVEPFAVSIEPAQILSKPEAPFQQTQRSVDLGAAGMIVSVGRGIREKENLALVESLAQVLGAEVAASRPICDSGWLPMERQVGSSGQTVSPKVYFAVGISGAIQHLVGMKGSKTIVAINKDESAPIFEAADYGIVGDLFEVVPALIEELRKAKS